MKRSEMLTLLKQLLEGNDLASSNSFHIKDIDDVAHDILAGLEEAGMLPPMKTTQESQMMPHTSIPEAIERTLSWDKED